MKIRRRSHLHMRSRPRPSPIRHSRSRRRRSILRRRLPKTSHTQNHPKQQNPPIKSHSEKPYQIPTQAR
jgi:hypothetical protein